MGTCSGLLGFPTGHLLLIILVAAKSSWGAVGWRTHESVWPGSGLPSLAQDLREIPSTNRRRRSEGISRRISQQVLRYWVWQRAKLLGVIRDIASTGVVRTAASLDKSELWKLWV